MNFGLKQKKIVCNILTVFSSALMNIPVLLGHFGFTAKEAGVYLATLELGMAPVSVVARKARLERTTTYEILQKLSAKGFAEFFVRKKTRYYSVLPPRQLLERFSGYVGELEAALPEMTAIENAIVGKPRITFYEGKEDLRRLYLDCLKAAKGEILNYFQPEITIKYLGWEWMKSHMVDRLQEEKLRVRVIMPDTPMSKCFLQQRESTLRRQRIAPAQMVFRNEVVIYENKVQIFSFEEDFAFLIESRDVAETQRALFELAWESGLLR